MNSRNQLSKDQESTQLSDKAIHNGSNITVDNKISMVLQTLT